MSLIKNKQEPQNNSDNLLIPQQEIQRLWEQIISLKETDRTNTEDKFKAMLLQAQLERMCQTLTDFMTATQSELKTMNDKQMKLLNLQEKYSQDVRASASKIINESYNTIEREQIKVFENVYNNAQKSAEKLIKSVENASTECRQAVKRTETTSDRLFKLACWRDLMWYAAPVFVLLDIVIRVVPWVMGLFGGG